MKRLMSILLVIWAETVFADNPVDTQTYLREFHQDPVRVMSEQLVRRDEEGKIVRELDTIFDLEDIRSGDFLMQRDEVREKICMAGERECLPPDERGFGTYSETSEDDQVINFLSQIQIIRRLNEMEQKKLTQVTLKESPWSESYWPIRSGIIGRRYAAAGFPTNANWDVAYSYILANPPHSTATSILSPAEKYDLLVGDGQWSFSRAMWRKGKSYHDTWGMVPLWVGICHGWAPASYIYPTPKQAVTVTGVRGHRVTFYPSDLRALASQLWAEAPRGIRFIGNRCKVSRPNTDAVGRVIDEKCFNSNPGTWHIAIVNQMGVAKRSFVFDATYDFQVWNYPIYAYEYSYFNPQTLAVSDRLASAIIPIEKFKIDKFKKYRSPKAKYIVGISMDLTYPIPVQPTTRNSTINRYHTVRYLYDLELDADQKIIGGEWYSNFHPDFIWTPAPHAKALSYGELKLKTSETWDGSSSIPDELIQAARMSSPRREPVGAIVETLMELSQ